MPNGFAYLVLYLSPLVVVLLFRTLPRAQALIWSVVGAYLFLPVRIGIDLPLLPVFNKDFLPVIAAAVMCLVMAPDRPGETMVRTKRHLPHAALVTRGAQTMVTAPERSAFFARQRTAAPSQASPPASAAADIAKLPKRPLLGNLLLLLAIGTPFLTAWQNAEPISAGPRLIAGLSIYDTFSMLLDLLVMMLPLLLARRYLGSAAHHEVLLRIICVAGLIYSLPALFEVRMSPQLNVWFYGYFPHSFAQQVRGDGFRPVVFIQHGLLVALFFAMTTIATFALWRLRRGAGRSGRTLIAGIWLLGVLVLCKTLGAMTVTLLLLPVVLLAPIRAQIFVAAVVAGIALLYPMLRGSDVIPVDSITALAASISEERAQSLRFRIDNEDALLDRANLKPIAGWGSWGRNRIYDTETGADISTTDGAWIIIVGVYGWLGYIAQFGLLTIPTFLLAWRARSIGLGFATAGLCLVLAVNLIDLIPNGSLTPVTWLIAGAILGYWERRRTSDSRVMGASKDLAS